MRAGFLFLAVGKNAAGDNGTGELHPSKSFVRLTGVTATGDGKGRAGEMNVAGSSSLHFSRLGGDMKLVACSQAVGLLWGEIMVRKGEDDTDSVENGLEGVIVDAFPCFISFLAIFDNERGFSLVNAPTPPSVPLSRMPGATKVKAASSPTSFPPVSKSRA